MNKIPFNKPFFAGKELIYIAESVSSGKISGDGLFTKKCHSFFQSRYNFQKCLLTTSCTDALEMSAILCNIKEGDEVICPSFTFVSTANAFALRGAKLVFADSEATTPNIDVEKLQSLITPKTKAIIPVHYAGVACDMDPIMDIAKQYNLFVIEDAAQAIDSYYKGQPLGAIGDFGAFSFHETKNIISGEGGMLVVQNDDFNIRAEIIREKGTNRSQFFRGEIDKYGWVDIGSSFLPSDITAAYLFAQLESIDIIQNKRKYIWDLYHKYLSDIAQAEHISLPHIPHYATNNAHMFYIICNSLQDRTDLIDYLASKNILAVFHYLSLHKSTFITQKLSNTNMPDLPQSDKYTDTLLRLPLYYELSELDVERICQAINEFYQSKN